MNNSDKKYISAQNEIGGMAPSERHPFNHIVKIMVQEKISYKFSNICATIVILQNPANAFSPYCVYLCPITPWCKKRSQIFNLEYSIFYDLDTNIYILILRVCHKHPPIFVILSVCKSFGVTPKSPGFHRVSPIKLTDNLKKNRWKNRPIFLVGHSQPIFFSPWKSFGETQA